METNFSFYFSVVKRMYVTYETYKLLYDYMNFAELRIHVA